MGAARAAPPYIASPDGCDVFTFRAGKIAVKSSFVKNRS
jgi:hypothetical protein